MFFYFQKFKQISKLLFNSAPNTSKLKTSVFNLMMNFWWRLLYNGDICPRQFFDLDHQHKKCPKVTNRMPENNIYILCKFLSSLFDYYESILFSLIGEFFFFTKTTSIIHCTNNNVKWEANVSWHKLHESISYLMQII